jgi:hypothetical protein
MEPLTEGQKREIILILAPEAKLRPLTPEYTVWMWNVLKQQFALYRHKKGGVYRKLYEGRHADDGSAVVIYEHLWPHERGIWVRNKAEFEEPGRFERITS